MIRAEPPPNSPGLGEDFPDGWPWQGNKTQQFRQIGNAVPPRMARLLAEVNRLHEGKSQILPECPARCVSMYAGV